MNDLFSGRHTRLWALAIVTLTSVAALGCGDDDADTDGGVAGNPAAGNGGKGSDTDGGAGTGGTTGSGGSTGSGGAMMPVMCGGVMCTVPGGSPLTACCVDDECGLGLQGTCQLKDMPGDLDATCPTHTTPSMTMLKGCCKADNKCGVMSMSGLGCIERTELASYAGGPLDEMDCGGGNDTDAGDVVDAGQ